jgi:hypothetical protein
MNYVHNPSDSEKNNIVSKEKGLSALLMIKVFGKILKKTKVFNGKIFQYSTDYLVLNCISCGCCVELSMIVCNQPSSESCFLCLVLLSVRFFFSFS